MSVSVETMSSSLDATSTEEAVIVLSRMFDAPRDLVWTALTDPRHVAKWYGGYGFTNPVCEMDVRPGGLWRHVMRLPDGTEFTQNYVFLEVGAPERLVWQSADHGRAAPGGPPTSVCTGDPRRPRRAHEMDLLARAVQLLRRTRSRWADGLRPDRHPGRRAPRRFPRGPLRRNVPAAAAAATPHPTLQTRCNPLVRGDMHGDREDRASENGGSDSLGAQRPRRRLPGVRRRRQADQDRAGRAGLPRTRPAPTAWRAASASWSSSSSRSTPSREPRSSARSS